MKKILIPTLLLSALFVGCANKEPLSTVEATDYAMSCDALLSEIKDIRTQLSTEKDKNLAKNVVGKTLTLGIYSADDEQEIMLRERAKALQLIYTIKQAKGECRALSQEDLKVDSVVKQTKDTIKETKKDLEN